MYMCHSLFKYNHGPTILMTRFFAHNVARQKKCLIYQRKKFVFEIFFCVSTLLRNYNECVHAYTLH